MSNGVQPGPTPAGNRASDRSPDRSPLLGDLGLSRPPAPSYSQLLQQLRGGKIKELELSPARRELTITYPDGRKQQVAVFSNDQLLLRTAQEARVPLTVRDDRKDEASAALAVNILLLLLLFPHMKQRWGLLLLLLQLPYAPDPLGIPRLQC